MMLYYFAALFTAALILLFSNVRSEMNRWAAMFLFSASIGGLADPLASIGWDGWSFAVSFLNHTLTPYSVLIFSMVYSDQVRNKGTRTLAKGALFIPVAIMLTITLNSAPLAVHFKLLLAWAAPYYLASCYFLLRSLWTEQDRRKKLNRLVTTIIIVPTLLAVLLLINVGKAISPDFDFFRYISIFIAYSLLAALLFAFVYGVLGVKLRFERDPLHSTMKAVRSGAALLNHTIKNELGKIAISSENLKRSLPDQNEEWLQHLQVIDKASDHLLAMMTRIHSQMRELTLREEPYLLADIVDECLTQHKVMFEEQHIFPIVSYSCRPTVSGDAVHIREVIGNVLQNAIEAMPEGGSLHVRLSAAKRGILLAFQDSGRGIPADRIAQVMEPFFSTKQGARNYGLGLSYVYNVMVRSGGTAEISSKEGEGTLVVLQFPRRKVLQWDGGYDA